MSNYTIKDLEQLSGIKAHTLRVWEQRYNIIEPKRTPTNIRYYDNVDLKLVLNISVLNEHGYKISRIARMTPGQLQEEVVRIARDYCHYPDQIHSLTLAMIDLDEDRFEGTMAANITRIGLERTMTDIVYPFLTRIGVLWQTEAINPAQEHFITHLIRQKLMVAIDRQTNAPGPESKQFVLFLPEGELHEIALLFASYLIKSRRHKVFYLGQNLPAEDLKAVCATLKPDYLFGVFLGTAGRDRALAYMEYVLDSCDCTLYAAGSIAAEYEKEHERLRVLYKVGDLVEMLDGVAVAVA